MITSSARIVMPAPVAYRSDSTGPDLWGSFFWRNSRTEHSCYDLFFLSGFSVIDKLSCHILWRSFPARGREAEHTHIIWHRRSTTPIESISTCECSKPTHEFKHNCFYFFELLWIKAGVTQPSSVRATPSGKKRRVSVSLVHFDSSYRLQTYACPVAWDTFFFLNA